MMNVPHKTIVAIQCWRFELNAEGDRPEIVGIVGGQAIRSGPIVRSIAPSIYEVRDGTAYALGEPDPTVEDPFVMPRPTMSARLLGALADVAAYRRGDGPNRVEILAAPKIENWLLTRDAHPILIGWVRGHPNLCDGAITTSLVVWIAEDESWARTVSRHYRLGRRARLGSSDAPDWDAGGGLGCASSSRNALSSDW